MGTTTVHKDLSLITLVPKFSGSKSAVHFEEFFSIIESAASIDGWQNRGCFEMAALELVNSARVFFQGCSELHAPDSTWQNLRTHSGKNSHIFIWTNFIIRRYKHTEKVGIRILSNLEKVAEP